jgi:putative hydrolase of the HAD superfamily
LYDDCRAHRQHSGGCLPKITAIFWDVGGVLLSNAWDRTQRQRAVQKFGLDEIEFDDRHDMLVSSLERGKITLKEYLEHTVFYRPRSFTPDELKDYMYSLSQPDDEALKLGEELSRSCRYFMATINNESAELNSYRIQTFGLREIFGLFVSSCYVGLRKPEDAIYRLALEITQRAPEECCFIDDRPLNLDAAKELGMHVIHMDGAAKLRADLQKLGVEI